MRAFTVLLFIGFVALTIARPKYPAETIEKGNVLSIHLSQWWNAGTAYIYESYLFTFI